MKTGKAKPRTPSAKSRLQTRMVDVGGKDDTLRVATAQCVVLLRSDVARQIEAGRIPKGNVLEVARVAGIMAAKRTFEIVPLCHPLALTGVDVQFRIEQGTRGQTRLVIEATVRCVGKTGVEMEALTAASVAALAIYDMCKTVQKDIEITETYLVEKTGGKTGEYRRREG